MSAEPKLTQPHGRRARAKPEVEEITPEQWEREFDAEARKKLGISGAEFRLRWERGEYADQDTDSVWSVAIYLGSMAPRK